jgi:mannosyltransferase
VFDKLRQEKDGLLITLLLSIFMGINLNLPEPWRDESATISAVNRTWQDLLALIQNIDFVHAFYYGLVKLLTLGNISVFQVRMISLLFISIAVFFIFRITKLLTNRDTAVLAALIFAVFPSSIFYASEARSYAVVLGIFMVSMYYFVRYYFFDSSSPVGFWFFLLLATYLQLMVVLFLPVALSMHLMMKKPLRQFVPFSGVYLVLIAPLLLIGFTQRNQISWLTTTSLKDPISFALEFSYLNAYYFVHTFSLSSLLVISLLGLGLTPFLLLRDRIGTEINQKTLVAFLLSWFLVPSYTLYTISTQIPYFYPRFVIYCIPALAILSAIAISYLAKKRVVFIVVLTFILSLGIIHLQELRFASAKSDWNLPRDVLKLAAYKTDKIWIIENPTLNHEERAMLNAYADLDGVFTDISLQIGSDRTNLFASSKPSSSLKAKDFDARGFISISFDCDGNLSATSHQSFLDLDLDETILGVDNTCWKIIHWK